MAGLHTLAFSECISAHSVISTGPFRQNPAHANRVCISAPFGNRYRLGFRSPALPEGCNGDAQRVPLPNGGTTPAHLAVTLKPAFRSVDAGSPGCRVAPVAPAPLRVSGSGRS